MSRFLGHCNSVTNWETVTSSGSLVITLSHSLVAPSLDSHVAPSSDCHVAPSSDSPVAPSPDSLVASPDSLVLDSLVTFPFVTMYTSSCVESFR